MIGFSNWKLAKTKNTFKHCQRHNGPEGCVLLTKVTSLRHISNSYTNLDQTSSESRPSTNFKISTKHQHINKILTKSSFRILTNIQFRNLNQTSAAKYWPNLSFRISPELQLQTPDQTLCWKSKQKFSFRTKPQLPNLQQTVANTILITNISNSNNLNKFWVGIFTRQGHVNQIYSTGVSEWVTDKHSQYVWSDSGLIRRG